MTTYYHRRRRVTTAPVVFNDDRDSIGHYLDAGETPPVSSFAAPRPSYVHRSSVDLSRLVDDLIAGGYGGGTPPFARSARRGTPRVRFVSSTKPQAWSSSAVRRASFAEFNRLRLDPRTRTCVARRQRREVLFARRFAPGRGMAPRRRTIHSQWSC